MTADSIQYFAVLGFLPNAETKLKHIISENVEFDVEWVSATDSKACGVVINANFLGSPQIKKFIDNTSAQVVCAYHSDSGKENAGEHDFAKLDLNKDSSENLVRWLNTLTDSARKNSVVNVDSQPETASKACTVRNSSQPKTNALNSSPKEKEYPGNIKFSDNFEELIFRLSKNQGYFIAKHDNKNVWIDAIKDEVYLDFDRDLIFGIDKIKWSEVDSIEPNDEARRISLSFWFFEAIWQANSLPSTSNKVDDKALYKLSRWPRPLVQNKRSEALRIAAFIQSNPTTPQQLSIKTGYSLNMIKSFINAGLLTNQIKITGFVEKGQDTPQKSKVVDKVKLGLLGRIRSKLNL